MGIFNKIRKGWQRGKFEHHFNENNKKISFNLHLLSKNKISYGKFVSNVSFLFSEQIKFSLISELTDYQINRIAIKLAFWLILTCYVSKYYFKDVNEVETFSEFYNTLKKGFLSDFLKNNPTIKNREHLQLLLEKKYLNYIKDPNHTLERFGGTDTVTDIEVLKIIVNRDVQNFIYDDFGSLNSSSQDYLNYLLHSLLDQIKEHIDKQ